MVEFNYERVKTNAGSKKKRPLLYLFTTAYQLLTVVSDGGVREKASERTACWDLSPVWIRLSCPPVQPHRYEPAEWTRSGVQAATDDPGLHASAGSSGLLLIVNCRKGVREQAGV